MTDNRIRQAVVYYVRTAGGGEIGPFHDKGAAEAAARAENDRKTTSPWSVEPYRGGGGLYKEDTLFL
jgi:hypothetical protein